LRHAALVALPHVRDEKTTRFSFHTRLYFSANPTMMSLPLSFPQKSIPSSPKEVHSASTALTPQPA
jgi:hypothetical protein